MFNGTGFYTRSYKPKFSKAKINDNLIFLFPALPTERAEKADKSKDWEQSIVGPTEILHISLHFLSQLILLHLWACHLAQAQAKIYRVKQ